jgi:LuxR family maltose regulon positive regulatory protein
MRSIVTVNLGMIHWYRGDLDQAGRALGQARRAALGSENDYARLTALLFLNRIDIARGRLRQGAAFCRQVIAQGERVPVVSLFYHDLGGLLYEWNELDAAAEQLEQAIDLCRRTGTFEWSTGSYSMLALIREAQGRREEAQSALNKEDQVLGRLGMPLARHLYNVAVRVQIALIQGDVNGASSLMDQASNAGSFSDHLHLLRARALLFLAQGRRAEAANQVEALLAILADTAWQHSYIQALALQAAVAPALEEGLSTLVQALTLAAPEGYVRTFVDLGGWLIDRIEACCDRESVEPSVRALAERLLATCGRAQFEKQEPVVVPTPLQHPALIEPLTDREREVLVLLAQGRTNQEMAQSLCLSVNTIKTHLKNIYGKLQVHSRRQAVARSRTIGLLH